MKATRYIGILLSCAAALSGCATSKAPATPGPLVQKEQVEPPPIVKPPQEPARPTVEPKPAGLEETKMEGKDLPLLPPDPVQPPDQDQQALMQSLGTIYFPFGQSTLDGSALQSLERLYQTMKGKGNYRLEGFCDDRGSDSYNLSLSEARATAVKRWLISRGMKEGNFSIVPYGEDYPADSGNTEEAYAKNRRVETYRAGAPAPEQRQKTPLAQR